MIKKTLETKKEKFLLLIVLVILQLIINRVRVVNELGAGNGREAEFATIVLSNEINYNWHIFSGNDYGIQQSDCFVILLVNLSYKR